MFRSVTPRAGIFAVHMADTVATGEVNCYSCIVRLSSFPSFTDTIGQGYSCVAQRPLASRMVSRALQTSFMLLVCYVDCAFRRISICRLGKYTRSRLVTADSKQRSRNRFLKCVLSTHTSKNDSWEEIKLVVTQKELDFTRSRRLEFE